MGEYNDPVDYETAAGGILDWLAKYLYDRYCDNREPMHDDDPRMTGIGDTEPWETAGKRKREYWEVEAMNLLTQMAKLFVGDFDE